MNKDHGYSVERCESGLSASIALATTSGEKAFWARRERYWRDQLDFAKARS